MNVWAKLIMEQNYVELARYVDRPELIHGVIQLFGQQLQVFRQLNREQLMQALRDLHWLSGEDGDWHLTTAAYAVLVAAMLGKIGREAPCAEYVAKMAENVILEKMGGFPMAAIGFWRMHRSAKPYCPRSLRPRKSMAE